MKVWLVCFLGLLGIAELYQWATDVPWLQQLPMPVYIGAGLGLAIVSNFSKRAGLPWQLTSPAELRTSIAPPNPTPGRSSQPPEFEVVQPKRSISFVVRPDQHDEASK